MFVRRSTSARLQSFITSSRVAAVLRSSGRLRQTLSSSAITPEPRRGIRPPIDTRSFISVVSDTRQPSPGRPSISASGIFTSVKNTSLNSASPVIWRSGFTSTPGASMSTTNAVSPACLTASGSVRTTSSPQRDTWAKRRPHLLAVDDPLVAVLHPTGGEAGEVGTGPGLREQLAPHLLAGEQRAEVALLLIRAPPLDDRRAAHAVADRVAEHGVRAAGRGDAFVDRLLVLGHETEPAVALREVHPGEAAVELLAEERDRIGRRRRELLQELVEQGIDPCFVGGRRGVGHGHAQERTGGSGSTAR